MCVIITPVVKSCLFGCCSNRTGSILISIITMLCSLILLALLHIHMKKEIFPKSIDIPDLRDAPILAWFLRVSFGLNFIASFLLLFGILLEISLLVVPWPNVMAFSLIVQLVYIIHGNKDFGVFGFISYVLMLVINLYFIIIVHSYKVQTYPDVDNDSTNDLDNV